MTTTLTRDPALAPSADVTAGIPFRRLLHVEWGKATDTRSARWLLAITGAGTALIMLAPLLARHSIDQTVASYLSYAALALVTLLPVVSILTMTTEWSQRTVLTTFTQEPRRARVVGAKITVSVLMALLAAAFGAVVTAAAIGIAAASGRHVVNDLGAPDVVGFVLFVLLNMVLAVAFGALLHNTAAAIVLFYVLPIAFGILGAAVSGLGHWLDPSTTFDWVRTGEWGGHGPQIAVSLVVWLVVPLWAGLVRTGRREVA